ncbi:CCA tRNA nucleotidyltransferase [Clostridium folliculivorans]|uniref:HDIG domain-containing protein n=1 Tax=Clostridium folliculivorans TaxID=2886038 RepID=A0A9W5Y652_9CLOT|nr:CCA tRNA nucleotidyltransferase [Clostridium folliculivorans]GKU27295.1 HDIG domain-containing protein [Clostridium folliculivorans]GKU32146.1 HDIG domain-containing protein [Clostridium folliculivorans]
MNIPKEVQFIIDKFYENGFEAFIVGGCVRDNIRGVTPNDYDITTNAFPYKIQSLFDKTIPTGIQHGTITVIVQGNSFEVTTYRIDGEYIDNRRPESVEFVSDIKEDLSRRDFTINAMAYNSTLGLIDYFGGNDDINKRLIKAVGDPDKRFNEDALRMMRAVRFASQLDFDIEKETLSSIIRNSHLIKNISFERIRDEFIKIIMSDNPRLGLKLLADTKILKYIIPELDACIGFDQHTPYHDKDIFNHTLSVVEKVQKKVHLRLAALFHDIAKPICFTLDENNIGHFYGHNNKGDHLSRKIFRRLRIDNSTSDIACTLVKEHMNVLVNATDVALKRMINRVGKDLVYDLFNLQRADILSSAPPFLYLEHVDKMESKITEILNSKAPLASKDLAINGNDLINELNLKPGKELGNLLNHLLEKVLKDPNLNTKENLFNLAKEYLVYNK